ncbi:MAG: cobalt transporter, permease protein CbiQ [Eubacterium sp.]|jgi:cobalt/nickel transport system permease protein|nr:cobalt transporter, permease protein CbiQ [Eubacterium sp.]
MTLTDKYAYSSSLAKVSPEVKILFSMVPLLLCIGFNSIIVSSATLVIMTLATVKLGRMDITRYISFIFIPFGFLVIGTLTILINRFEPDQTLLMGIRIGRYAYGINGASLMVSTKLVLKALGSVSCMYFLSLNTPMSDLFQVLGKTKLPKVIVILMELIYRYIFVLLEEVERMIIAKDSRLGNCNFRTALRSMGELVSMLFIRAYQRSGRIYAALESRGYNGQFNTIAEEYIYSKKMKAASILVSCLLLCLGMLDLLLL